MPRRLLALGLVLAGAAAIFASRRRSSPVAMSQNGGSPRRAARLQRELEHG